MSKKENSQYNGIFGSAKGERRSFASTLFAIILLAITLSLSLALIIAYLAPHVPPSLFGQFTIVGLFAPILYIMVMVCTLLWLIMRRWVLALIFMVLLIPGLFHFNDFYKQLGFNSGLGLRIDATFVILRIDLGVQLHNPGRPVGERWIHDFKWKNMALNFGVGYPF